MSIFTFTELILNYLVLHNEISFFFFFLQINVLIDHKTHQVQKQRTPPHPQIIFLINKGTLTYMYFFKKVYL